MPNGTWWVPSILGELGQCGAVPPGDGRDRIPRVAETGDRVPAEAMGNEDKAPPALRTENKYQG